MTYQLTDADLSDLLVELTTAWPDVTFDVRTTWCLTFVTDLPWIMLLRLGMVLAGDTQPEHVVTAFLATEPIAERGDHDRWTVYWPDILVIRK